ILRNVPKAKIAAAVGLSLALLASGARAAGPLPAQGQPITTSAYGVDLFQGPVLASSRLTALAGASAPLAEGAEANGFNAAAPAVRAPWSTDRLDYDVTAGITIPTSLKGNDFYNNHSTRFTFQNFVFVTAGGTLQYGPLGVGLNINLQQYALGSSAEDAVSIPNTTLRLATAHLLAAYAFMDDELVLGVGARGAILGIVDTSGAIEKELITMSGIGPEMGALWAPRHLPVRAGLTARAPVRGRPDSSSRTQADAAGDRKIGDLYLPNQIQLPAEIEGGFAFQLGRRPINLGWKDGRNVPAKEIEAERRIIHGQREPDAAVAHRILLRRYRGLSREKVLFTTALLVSGRTLGAVGFESFLSHKVDRSGEVLTVTPRVGMEIEAVPSWLQVRAGSYLEPTRFKESSPRLHGTTGFDTKLFSWTVFNLLDEGTYFRAGGSVDVARGYFGWGVSAGIWR
ncbi:MAG: hypothetical protein ABIP39_13225, partial [Polyangiaceae bacterium]